MSLNALANFKIQSSFRAKVNCDVSVDVLVVLLGRIELPTSPLPRECSTTELQQHVSKIRTKPKRAFKQVYFSFNEFKTSSLDAIYSIKYNDTMPNSKSKKVEPNSRENRLKAALKANMAKRKAQVKLRASVSSDKIIRKD